MHTQTHTRLQTIAGRWCVTFSSWQTVLRFVVVVILVLGFEQPSTVMSLAFLWLHKQNHPAIRSATCFNKLVEEFGFKQYTYFHDRSVLAH
jgi:K+-transporting ATPase c subunit